MVGGALVSRSRELVDQNRLGLGRIRCNVA